MGDTCGKIADSIEEAKTSTKLLTTNTKKAKEEATAAIATKETLAEEAEDIKVEDLQRSNTTNTTITNRSSTHMGLRLRSKQITTAMLCPAIPLVEAD